MVGLRAPPPADWGGGLYNETGTTTLDASALCANSASIGGAPGGGVTVGGAGEAHEDDRLLADLAEALADPLFGGQQPPAQDLKLVVQNTPAVAHAFLSMHQALRRAGERLAELDDTLERTGAQSDPTPYEEVRDFFHYMDNYVDGLDREARGPGQSSLEPGRGHPGQDHPLRTVHR